MGKLVVLKVTSGNFAKGFSITLEIGAENARPSVTAVGSLPPFPELPLYYDRWRKLYDSMGGIFRIRVTQQTQPKLPSRRKACRNAAKVLEKRLNTWYESNEYRPIREKWLEQLSPNDEIRVILQTEDQQLRYLPWNLLDFMKRYPKAEITLSALQSEAVQAPPRSPQPLSILAILGDSTGIDVEVDRALLNQLPQADVTFLAEPSRKELTDRLWSRPWDMLFFAGHSSSANGTGLIFINQTDSLTIAELSYALQRTVQAGLKFAIFNSCDGLGLARDLADLQIPQVIVMREPVPDRVAQEFLKYFLHHFSSGKPFALAFREAREQLQHLEDQHPCATWLPIICQNPAVLPPTWKELVEEPEPAPLPPISPKRSLAIASLTSLAITTLICGVRFFGMMQPLELSAFDRLMRLRPIEPPDPRLLVITIDNKDLKNQIDAGELKDRSVSISDKSLTNLLTVLTAHQPRAIGLDLYYDDRQPSPKLRDYLKNNNDLFTICAVGFNPHTANGIAPPLHVPSNSGRITFADFSIPEPPNDILRRHLFAIPSQKQSLCPASYAFSTAIALQYLAPYLNPDPNATRWETARMLKIAINKQSQEPLVAHGFVHQASPATSKPWQPYDITFPPLESHTSGYQEGIDNNGVKGMPINSLERGTQLLLNYRVTAALSNDQSLSAIDLTRIAQKRSLAWFLSNPPKAELDQLINNKIVLIGVTTNETGKENDDYFKTPYGDLKELQTPGVFIHAHMISQLLSYVLDGRPLLWTWNRWGEVTWIAGWSLLGGLLTALLCLRSGALQRLLLQVALAIGVVILLLYGSCVVVLIGFAGWLPLVPPSLAVLMTSSTVMMLSAQRIRALKSTYITTDGDKL
jgi:CHASE2 domain-containing sensor protein